MTRQRGVSLIEVIMFIIIVSIGVTALLAVFSTTVRKSSDPLIQKQMLAIAEALLEEVQSKPFTYCDPDDANATTATRAIVGTGGCATDAQNDNKTHPTSETRTSTTNPFDNVGDYGGTTGSITISPISDVSGTAISGLGAYSAQIAIAAQALGTVAATDGDGAPQSLAITVTVTGPGGATMSLQGYRTRYAPNAVP
ncbi:MAG TPA: type II secretion system protein [Burkholderiales bacterium]|nr:type II secretion system protein [Burkholderiales bacterium]